ncbi:MAG: chemotaxis protein CheX [Armatimonadetes bacterium]|nr:chemotaxis protein CheX [Armatimonadota bacterium]
MSLVSELLPRCGSQNIEVLALRVEYVEPFIQAAFYVLQEVAGAKCERGPLSMRKGTTFTTNEITVVVGVTGQIQGMGLYGMSVATALKVAGAMMGQELVALDEMALSAVSELGNMVSGQAATLLAEAGLQCDITPPTVIRGVGIEISVHVPVLTVPVSTDKGNISIDIAVCRDKDSGR